MIATLTFNLPEEQEDFDMAIKGHKYSRIIDEVFDELRKNIKYGRTPQFEGLQVSDEQLHEVLENVRDMIAKVKVDYE